MPSRWRKFLYLFDRAEKRRGSLLMGMIVVMALLETAGIASVMPFLSVLSNPGVIESNPTAAALYAAFGFDNVDQFLFALGVAAFAVMLLSAGFRALTLYLMNRFIEMRRHSIGERLLKSYLNQPYEFFLNRHSSDLAKSILSETDQLIANVLRPGMMMAAYAVVVAAIVVLLIAVDPKLAVSVAVVVGGMYGVMFCAVQGLMSRAGKDRSLANKERFAATSDALSGIKDIKVLGRESVYLAKFRMPSIRQARHFATSQTLSLVPRYFIEALAFGGIIAITLFLLAGSGGTATGALDKVLPLLGLYALAGYRLLPAMQHVYQGVTKLQFGQAALDGVYEELVRNAVPPVVERHVPELRFENQVEFHNVHYTFPNTTRPALAAISLDIPVGSTVGFVGPTGAGKSTLIDLLLGLLSPTSGRIAVDGVTITDSNVRAWQRLLGYVPQSIFMSDASLAENIALGVPRDRVDLARVEQCARLAQVHDFIVNEIPLGYESTIGERGVRLSGGERQRIGIARALYHDPPILVFDEATSALDTVTEQAVMSAITALAGSKTIVMIAHRLSTVRNCQKIVLMERGTIAGQGTFEELAAENRRFRKMVSGAVS